MFLFERPIAHRGLHDNERTENSMAAFKNALAHGYNIGELLGCQPSIAGYHLTLYQREHGVTSTKAE